MTGNKNSFWAIALVVCAALLSSCGEKPAAPEGRPVSEATAPPVDAKREALLNDLVAVWTAPGDGLIYITRKDNDISMIAGGEVKAVRVGAVDPVNESVNLVVALAEGGQGVMTMRKVYIDKERNSYRLQLIDHIGTTHDFGFVRRISDDDMVAIKRAESITPEEAAEAKLQERHAAALTALSQAQTNMRAEYRAAVGRASMQNSFAGSLLSAAQSLWPQDLNKACGAQPVQPDISEEGAVAIECAVKFTTDRAQTLQRMF